MSKLNITVCSKNKSTFQNFIKFLRNKFPILKLQITLKHTDKKTVRKKITLLKSTHINKAAQEKYEYKIYSYTFQTYSFRTKKYLMLLKKLRNNLFPDIKLDITNSISGSSNDRVKYFQPENYKLNLNKLKITQKLNSKNLMITKNNPKTFQLYLDFIKKTTNYLKILDSLGEVEIKTKGKETIS